MNGWTGQECPKCVEQSLDWPEDWVGKDFAWQLDASGPSVTLHWTEAGSKRAACGAELNIESPKGE